MTERLAPYEARLARVATVAVVAGCVAVVGLLVHYPGDGTPVDLESNPPEPVSANKEFLGFAERVMDAVEAEGPEAVKELEGDRADPGAVPEPRLRRAQAPAPGVPDLWPVRRPPGPVGLTDHRTGAFDVSVDFLADFVDEPDLQLSKFLSATRSPTDPSASGSITSRLSS